MKRLVVAYIVTLHLVVGGMLWKSDFLDRVNSRLGLIEQLPKPEISEYYHRILRYHERSVDSVPDDSVIFIGDSITQGLCVSAVQPNAVNFGIGSDTTTGVLMRIPAYMPALERAKCIVLAIGVKHLMTDSRGFTNSILDSSSWHLTASLLRSWTTMRLWTPMATTAWTNLLMMAMVCISTLRGISHGRRTCVMQSDVTKRQNIYI